MPLARLPKDLKMAYFYFFPLTFLRFFPSPSGKPGQNDEKGERLVFVTPRKDIRLSIYEKKKPFRRFPGRVFICFSRGISARVLSARRDFTVFPACGRPAGTATVVFYLIDRVFDPLFHKIRDLAF